MREKAQDNSGVFLSSCITPFKNAFSATVNTNLQTDMPDGQQQVHGTVMANFQEGKAEVQ